MDEGKEGLGVREEDDLRTLLTELLHNLGQAKAPHQERERAGHFRRRQA